MLFTVILMALLCLAARPLLPIDGAGFTMVEILTMCPTDWYVEPTETPGWIEENFAGTYPLKILKSV